MNSTQTTLILILLVTLAVLTTNGKLQNVLEAAFGK